MGLGGDRCHGAVNLDGAQDVVGRTFGGVAALAVHGREFLALPLTVAGSTDGTALGDRGVDHAGADRGDVDAVWIELAAERLGQTLINGDIPRRRTLT